MTLSFTSVICLLLLTKHLLNFQLCQAAMSTAAKLGERNVNIRLLACFDFLSKISNFPYPVDFMLTTLKQLVQSNLQENTKKKFGFKILKTFLFNKCSVQEMHKLKPQIVEDFLHFISEHFPSYAHLTEFISPPQGHSIDNQNSATFSMKSSSLREMFEGYRNHTAGFQKFLDHIRHCDGKLTRPTVFIKKIMLELFIFTCGNYDCALSTRLGTY